LYTEGDIYLAILQDKTEAPGDRLERTKGIGGVSHPAEHELGPRRRKRLEVRFVLVFIFCNRPDGRIRGTRVCASSSANIGLDLVGYGRMVCFVRKGWLDGRFWKEKFAYRSILDHERPGDQKSVK
jgi:hypothetical protein